MIAMNLLVTGGLGFIGSNFIRLMLNRHDDCRILNLDAQGFGSNIQNLADYKDDRRYTFFRGDIADSSLVSSLVEKADLVVNFAAETHVDRSISRPDSFLHSNVNGVFCLLEAIRDHNPSVRYVQISTDEVYGDILRGSSTEDSTLRPSSPYSASKAAGDVFVLAYARTYGLEAMITRCTNNYGPYQFPEKLIPKTIIRAKEGLKIPIYGTGENVRDWIYVTDHCRAVEQVLNRGEGARSIISLPERRGPICLSLNSFSRCWAKARIRSSLWRIGRDTMPATAWTRPGSERSWAGGLSGALRKGFRRQWNGICRTLIGTARW